ncbi:MAG: ABC transporter substrate-binding protein [Dehalococcoidia bacterium]
MTLLRTWLRRGPAVFAIALVASLFIVACSDEDGDSTPTETASTAEATETATGEATETATATGEAGDAGALKIGYLADFTGALAEFGPAIQTGVEMAIEDINAAGGVHGMPVELATGDTQLDQTIAVEEARRLIEIEGVHAIVGPLASGITIAVAESVASDAEIPVISPSATSPGVTGANDGGFLFRTTTSDAAQGIILAQLIEDEGVDNVGVVYLNNAYGQGLADALEGAFSGTITSASIEESATSYVSELQAAKAGGADYLVAIGYPEQARIFLREAIENDIFTQFFFVDGTKSPLLIDDLGADTLEGFKGTAAASGPESDSTAAWNAQYEEKYGALPETPYVREAYDATIAIAFAAEKAGSNDGTAIRDELAAVAGPPGEAVIAGAEGIAAGFGLIQAGTDIDYDGAATSVDWNDAGDVTSGYIGVWQYQDGAIVELEAFPFTLE